MSGKNAAEPLVVDLGSNGGHRTFHSWASLKAFIEAEREAWAWLQGTERVDPGHIGQNVSSRLNQLRSEVSTREQNGEELKLVGHLLTSAYDINRESIIHHNSEVGETISSIKDQLGPGPAAFAYSFYKGRVGLNNVDSIEKHKASILVTLPAMIDPQVIRNRLSRERENTKEANSRSVQKWEQFELDRIEEWNEYLTGADLRASEIFRRRLSGWRRRSRRERLRSEAAIKSIQETESSFLEKMRLKAPVEYWTNKADDHQKAENKAVWRLGFFFPIAIMSLTSAFFAASYLLLHKAGPTPPPALYFIVSAALASIGALIFWIGRLLARVYLSEQHLRKDASERAVMTTTYLALTVDAAANDSDRHIILSALFRNSADGIVKDDGPNDLSVASLLSKISGPGRL